jgi:molybdopterin synthase catalytic subunit
MEHKAHIQISFNHEAIDVEKASALPSIGCGGECIFVGKTRPEDNPTHGKLLALSYECYEELAEREIRTLAEEVINRFEVRHVRVTHSVSTVKVHEASVVIAVSSDHREDAFTACKFMIDLLKQRVPIWKQEMWEDGTTWSNGIPLTTT